MDLYLASYYDTEFESVIVSHDLKK